MIDFAALTLGPNMATFGRPVTVLADGARPAFDATGIWATRAADVTLVESANLNTTVITLGIRLSDWARPPEQFMRLEVPAAGGLPAEGRLYIDDVDLDHQGGAKLVLKRGKPR
ncbi:UNVERIFIED_CONTAM: hypothetical protein Q9R58_28030 [Methylobacteriaceae bacterium AG10]|nr:hypothetical protein [Methylobacteriaceae bacterium AG10]